MPAFKTSRLGQRYLASLFLILFSGLFVSCNRTPPVVGTWTGSITLGPMNLPLTLKIEQKDSKLEGTILSTQQSSRNAPLDHLSFVDSSLAFDVPAVKGSFKGELQKDGNTIQGEWHQGPVSAPITFSRLETK